MKIILKAKEKIDYEKIREITREIVKEELQKSNVDQPTQFPKEDIQDAECKDTALTNEDAGNINEEGKKVGFWKSLWLILWGKGSEDSSFATALLTGVLSVAFNLLFVIGMIVFVVAAVGIGLWICQTTWTGGDIVNKIATIAFSILVCILLFLISVMFRGVANDMSREKDRNYIVALFSGVVSFVALIVSLVALVKG